MNLSHVGNGARVPDARIRLLTERPPRANGGYVFVLDDARTRVEYNFGLQCAVEASLPRSASRCYLRDYDGASPARR